MTHPQQELAWIWFTLLHDMRVCESHLDSPQPRTGNPWRRHYVRAFFALVEAVTHNMRELVLARHKEQQFQLDEDELSVLIGKRIELRDNGTLKASRRRDRTLPKILFTLKLFARYVGKEDDYKLLKGKPEWKQLEEVYTIRNSITHPGMLKSLLLSDDKMMQVKHAGEWFIETAIDLIEFDFTKLQAEES